MKELIEDLVCVCVCEREKEGESVCVFPHRNGSEQTIKSTGEESMVNTLYTY